MEKPLNSETGVVSLPEFKPLNKSGEIHQHRRRLPHWEQPGCTYFITFRLADSMPQEKLKAWQERKAIWLAHHPPPWSEDVANEYEEHFVQELQKWLDAGYGGCALRDSRVRSVVENSLRHFDGARYALDAFVVMPNHVHVLVQPMPGFSLSDMLHSWKSYSSKVFNQSLGRAGAMWLDENFDHAVRSLSQLEHFRCYIAANPVKAGLREGEFALWYRVGIPPAVGESRKSG